MLLLPLIIIVILIPYLVIQPILYIFDIVTNRDKLFNATGKFGYDITNPIPVSVTNGYLNTLRDEYGIKIRYKRVGSVYSKNIKKSIDKYLILNFRGEELTIIYTLPYQDRSSKKTPSGFSINYLPDPYPTPFSDARIRLEYTMNNTK